MTMPGRPGSAPTWLSVLVAAFQGLCGRYASFLLAEALAAISGVTGPLPNFPPSWNLAPTAQRQIIRRHPDSGERRSTCWLGGCCRASQGPEGRSQADQRSGRHARHVRDIPRRRSPASLPGASRRLLRMAAGRGRQAPRCDRPAGWASEWPSPAYGRPGARPTRVESYGERAGQFRTCTYNRRILSTRPNVR